MSSEPEVGSPAPNFSLPAHTDRTISLADLRGRKAVLLFYVFDFSPG